MEKGRFGRPGTPSCKRIYPFAFDLKSLKALTYLHIDLRILSPVIAIIPKLPQ